MELLETPCKCGWKYPTYHVCPDLSKPCLEEEKAAPKSRQREVTAERWRQHRAETADRDAEIVDMYKAGNTYQHIADELQVAKHTVIRVVKRAAGKGDVVLRGRMPAPEYGLLGGL